jgi:hypothetical protein
MGDFPDRSQQDARHRGYNQDIRHQQVGLVVSEGRTVDAGRVQAGRAGDRDRRGGVPFVEPAAVHVRVDLAADHGRHLSSG